MADTLSSALQHYLGGIGEPVAGVLALEVDWGQHTPPITDAVTPVTFQGAIWWQVLTDSELVLRRALCQAPGGRVIWLLASGVTAQAPLDVRARLHGRTVFRLGLRAYLQALTGREWPPEVDHSEWRTTVERHLDFLVRQVVQAGALNWAISHNDLEALLLKAAFGITLLGRTSPQLLADLIVAQLHGGSPPSALELAILEAHLRAALPLHADTLVWASEEAGRAATLVRTGLMMAAERDVRLAPNWGSLTSLRAKLVGARQIPEAEAMSGVMDLAVAALELLPRPQMRAVVEDAERDLVAVLPPGSYVRWFPTTLVAEIDRLAEGVAAGHLPPPERLQQMRGHLFAGDYVDRLDVLETLTTAVSGRRQQADAVALLRKAPDQGAVSAWAGWYAQYGSVLDLAALELMRYHGQGAGLRAAISQVLKDHWDWRNGLNRAFATRYLASYETSLHYHDGAFGVHHILRWIVRPLLEEGRRVLLIVVDGMSYPDFWYMMRQWASAKTPAYPAHVRSALALLPSVTSVSRRALFLDNMPTDRLDDDETYEQKARTGEVQALAKALHGRKVHLYSKGNLEPEQLLQELQFASLDCIALIINAIDDDLKNSTTNVKLPELQDLDPLNRAVQTALQADWAVLITADHGHTWHRDKKLRRGPQVPGGGERFAPLASGGLLPEDAVASSDANIVRVQDGQRVALLATSGAYFGQNPRRGYHGGVALEEVVVPCVMLTRQPPATGELPAGLPVTAQDVETEASGLVGMVLTLRTGNAVRVKLPFSLEPS